MMFNSRKRSLGRRTRWLVSALALFCVVPVTGSTPARGQDLMVNPPASRPEDEVLAQWKASRNANEMMLKGFASLGRHRLADLMSLRVENRFLSLTTPMPAIQGEQPRKVTIDDLPGFTFINVHRDPSTGTLDRYSLSAADFPREKITTTISVSYQGGSLTITRSTRTADAMHQVIFMQQRGVQSSGGDAVELFIVSSSDYQPQQLTFTSPDFLSFLRDHPEQTDVYIRPMLRQLQAEPLLCPDPSVAWQVFSDLRKPDPAMARRVEELLPGLNDSDHHVRNQTLNKLRQYGRDAVDVIENMDRSKLTPEQNVRLDRFLLQYEQLSPKEVGRLRADPTFLLDCLYSNDMTVRQAASDRLRTTFRPDLEFDVNAPAEVRAAAVTSLRQQLTPGR
jgi:hypothetical protein